MRAHEAAPLRPDVPRRRATQGPVAPPGVASARRERQAEGARTRQGLPAPPTGGRAWRRHLERGDGDLGRDFGRRRDARRDDARPGTDAGDRRRVERRRRRRGTEPRVKRRRRARVARAFAVVRRGRGVNMQALICRGVNVRLRRCQRTADGMSTGVRCGVKL